MKIDTAAKLLIKIQGLKPGDEYFLFEKMDPDEIKELVIILFSVYMKCNAYITDLSLAGRV